MTKPNHIIFLVTILFLVSHKMYAQDRFHITNDAKSTAISFKMVNDLVIVPVEVNGSKLNFLLDTGVNNTIMFNLSAADSTNLKDTKKIRVRGLGEGNYIDAIQSKNNYFKIGRIVNGQHMIYLIPGKEFDLSARLGIDVNGIVGGDLFRDMVVDINYTSKRIRFHSPSKFSYKKCKKCEEFDLSFFRNKPYVDIKVKSNGKIIDTKLLVDTGGSKTLWLFDKSNKDIELPEKYFSDFLGKGLSGNIFGRRSKIEEVILGRHKFMDANVAYPDSASVATAYRFKARNGSIGAGILKRFRILIDYPGKKMTLVRKSKYHSDPFLYNKSGLDIIHAGQMLVQQKKQAGDGFSVSTNSSESKPIVQILYELVYDFKPMYMISYVRENSPAANAGLKEKDIILQVNGKAAYSYKLEQIIHLFSKEKGKEIRLLIERQGKKMFYSFRLEDIF